MSEFIQIFVSGTWSDKKAAPYAAEAVLLGKLIALGGYDLTCGPGTGIAKYTIKGYKSIMERGKVRFYLPRESEMQKVGEEVGLGSDQIIKTDLDYPLRNIYQVSQSHALIAVTGGDGALEEVIAAMSDYELPVGILKDSGNVAKALEMISGIFAQWSQLLRIDTSIEVLFDHVNNSLSAKR